MGKMSNVHVALQEQGKSQEEIENCVLTGAYYHKDLGLIGTVEQSNPHDRASKRILKAVLGFDY